MGTWGTALYSDDLAADIRDELRGLIAEGRSVDDAVRWLARGHDNGPPCHRGVFWLAVADTAWRLGRPDLRATEEALRVVESGSDLERWVRPADRRKREAVLRKLAEALRSDAPPPKRVAKPYRGANAWEIGEVVGYRLASGRWTAFRVIGHHEDRGGRFAICEPLNWTGVAPPSAADVATSEVRPAVSPHRAPQFLFDERSRDRSRLVRGSITSTPKQRPGGYTVFVAPYVDRLLSEMFGLE